MDDMIRLCAVLNPFDPLNSREMKDVPAGRPIRELVAEFNVRDGYDIEVSVDGVRLTAEDKWEFVPRDGSSVVFVAVPQGGDGKNPLALIASLALLAVAPGISSALTTSLWYATSISSATILAMTPMVTAGILVAGGLLISSIFPLSSPSTGSPADSSPTYSWNVENNAVAEGSVLPELFGTHRVTPPIIGHYIHTDGALQYLNLLFAVAGHSLDSITSIRVNETAIEDMTDIDVVDTRDKRLGAVNQSVLQHFDDTRADVLVGAKLAVGEWTTRTTTGNTVEEILVTLSFPKGLFYAANDGSLKAVKVKIRTEYKLHSAGDETYVPLTTYNTVPILITTGKWYGCAYEWVGVGNNPNDPNDPYSWVIYEEGSADPGAHYDGEPYTVNVWKIVDGQGWTWTTVTYVWKWFEGQTMVEPGTQLLDYYIVQDNKVQPFHKVLKPIKVAAGQYDIRCALVEEPSTTNAWSPIPPADRTGSDVYFDSFQEVVTDDFQYPGVSLLALRALATDQLSGSIPRIDMLATRSTVPVWTGAAYAQKVASNPAWAAYHLLHQARYKGTGSITAASSYDVLGVPADRINYSDFVEWSSWCNDPFWVDGNGTPHHLEPYTCNVYFDTAMSLRKALDIVGACGRGTVTQIGSKFTVIVDRPEQMPVQRFLMTPGNIAAGSFTEEFLPMGDRANSVEVTYFDAAQDYSRQSVEVYASDFDTTDREINKASVTLMGVTSRQKAIDYARFLLNSNRYLVNTVSIEADVDTIACIPGDVIEVSHDVPQWGYGGRVVSATASGVTLDRSVTLQAATTYNIMVKHQDDDARELRVIADAPGTYTTLSLTAPWTKIPAAHAVYSVGAENAVVKEFRVLKIGTGQDLKRKLTCIEYLEEVFEDGATIPDPENPSDLPMVANLTATEVYRGGQDTRVYLKWTGVALFWNVYKRLVGGAWEFVRQAYNPSCDIAGLDYGVVYEFAVTPSEDPGDGETVTITLRGKIDPPGNVPWYSSEESINVTEYGFTALIEWGEVTDFDLWGYELRFETIDEPAPYPNFSPDWSLATMLFRGNARSYVWSYKAAGSYCLHVRAVDAFGNYSTNSTTHIEVIGDPNQPEGNAPVFSGPNVILSWSQVAGAFAIDHFVISYGTAYETATAAGTTKGTTFSVNVTWGGLRRFWITAVDVAGNEGEPESIDVQVVSPGAVGALTPRVIDNNVLLQWTPPTTGSLPISYYEISRGDLYETSETVGTVMGTFSAIIEQSSGSYTYWVVGVDSAGNSGTPVGIPATVNQPPDYNVFQAWESTFSGTKTSALIDDGKLYAPINITEMYQEHFTTYSHDSPFEQVASDYPLWIQPVPNTASYQEVFDYEAVLTGQATISLEVTSAQEYGSATITPSIEVSADGETYGTPVEAYTALESGFRYVRITLYVTGASNQAILRVDSIRVKLDMKLRTDSGLVQVTSSGQQVDFNESFVDVVSIVAAVKGSTALFAIYDFTDAPNPGHFHLYIFDHAGNDVSTAGHYVSWTARGVL